VTVTAIQCDSATDAPLLVSVRATALKDTTHYKTGQVALAESSRDRTENDLGSEDKEQTLESYPTG